MPPLIHRQFYIFATAKGRSAGVWARCTRETEAKLERGMVEPENRYARRVE
jgi:cytolysin-activating lysine-acyltransferase